MDVGTQPGSCSYGAQSSPSPKPSFPLSGHTQTSPRPPLTCSPPERRRETVGDSSGRCVPLGWGLLHAAKHLRVIGRLCVSRSSLFTWEQRSTGAWTSVYLWPIP